MTIAYVNSAFRHDTNSGSPTHALASTTAGNGLIVPILWRGSGALSAVAISGETITSAHAVYTVTLASIVHNIQVYHVKNLATGGTKTVTSTISVANTWAVGIVEVSGQDTTDFHDGSYNEDNTAAAGSDPPQISLTTNTNNDFVIGVEISANANAPIGEGWSDLSWTNWDFRPRAEYKADIGAAGPYTVAFGTEGFGDNWMLVALGFKPAGVSTTPIDVNNLPIDSLAGGEII